MTERTTEPYVMALADIAALAQVRRAVVSTWRRRPSARGGVVPFPRPVATRQGQELFAMADVVAWLEATGRGNNSDITADALAHAHPLVPMDDETLLVALEALLCLKATAGADLGELSPDEIVTVAHEVDPEDDHLVRELLAAGDNLRDLAGYAERLSDSTWDALSAMTLVRARWTSAVGRSQPALSATALTLFGQVGAAVALDMEGEVVLHDPLSSDPDLVDAVITHLGEALAVQVLVTGDDVASRADRRLHWAQGRSVVATAPPSAMPLVITRVPGPGASSDSGTVLESADDVQLDLDEEQRALIVGPAAVLCDALRDTALDQQRDHFIRLGRLRCALRLPQGLVADGSRMALGLWVLGGERTAIRVESRRLATADLTNENLRPDVISDVTTDVVSSMTDLSRTTHAFRYARLHLTSALLAGSGPLVAVGTGPDRVRADKGAEQVVNVRRLATELEQGRWQPPLHGFAVGPGEALNTPADVSIDEAEQLGLIRIRRGTRMDVDVPASTSGVRIIGAQDVRDPTAPRRGLDPIEVEQAWPRARRTEPGDVIFCTSPRPVAMVDHEGLSFVAYPARAIRCSPASGVVPEAVVRAINAQPVHSRRWRAWRIPRMPVDQASAVEEILRRLTADETHTRERLDQLSALAHDLARGVASGALTLTPETTQEGP